MNTNIKLPQLSKNLRKYRTAKGFTYRKVAKALGYSEFHISKVERGIHIPSLSGLMALAALYGCTLGDLFAEIE